MEKPAGTDATTMYHRMAGWYNDAPESAALRAAWGAYPASPETLEAWPGFVQVTNAFLDHAGPPPIAPEAVQVEEEGPPVSEEPQEPPLMTEEEREAPLARSRDPAASLRGTLCSPRFPRPDGRSHSRSDGCSKPHRKREIRRRRTRAV